MKEIKSVAVLGSGVMGASIAAHFANAGVPVLLLDLPQKGFGKKDSLAKEAIERLKTTSPAPLTHKRRAELITPGNLEDDLEKIKNVDWVVEAVVENLDIKKNLYAQLEAYRGKHTVVSSNTSTIPLKSLMEGRSADFKKHFVITHFFNPPRYMRLLEVIQGPDTLPEVLESVTDFCDRSLGKTVVLGNDTPGFIANRIGIYWLQTALVEAFDTGMTVEEVDLIFSRPVGIPKTGVFGLIDLVGLDLIPLMAKTMRESLPSTDPYVATYKDIPLIKKMIEEGYIGRKGKGGFYRLNQENGQKVKQVVNLQTGSYAPVSREHHLGCLDVAKEGIRPFLSYGDHGAHYAWSVLSKVLCYAASLVPEIADTPYALDQAMKLGYNWKYGPFELLDKIGVEWFVAKLQEEGRELPTLLKKAGSGSFYKMDESQLHYLTIEGKYTPAPRRQGILLLEDIKRTTKPIEKSPAAALWDIGDGVCCLEFTSKKNTVGLGTMEMLEKATQVVKDRYKALVIYNETDTFSAGADIGMGLFAANLGAWDLLENFAERGQKIYHSLKYAPFPVVSAPSGLALGGGCELLLHSDAVQAHVESYIGLVEVGVGLVPAWGGCKEMLGRWSTNSKAPGGSMVAVAKVFEIIGTAQVSRSAEEAKDMLFLRSTDGITMNRDRLLADAKAKALELAKNYHPPKPWEYSLPGSVAKVAMLMAVKGFVKAGKASAYDEEIAKKLSVILSGGDTDITDKESEEAISTLERTAFMTLIRNPKTLARMEHILETGKPLRN